MSVVIPAGALPGTDVVVVTVQAYAGKYHVYEFLPHGIEFEKPIQVEFDTRTSRPSAGNSRSDWRGSRPTKRTTRSARS
jgi:hypothetical protein